MIDFVSAIQNDESKIAVFAFDALFGALFAAIAGALMAAIGLLQRARLPTDKVAFIRTAFLHAFSMFANLRALFFTRPVTASVVFAFRFAFFVMTSQQTLFALARLTRTSAKAVAIVAANQPTAAFFAARPVNAAGKAIATTPLANVATIERFFARILARPEISFVSAASNFSHVAAIGF